MWVNIFDLAGCKFKLGGFLATFIYIILIQFMFWGKFIPTPQNNIPLFVFTQALTIIIPFIGESFQQERGITAMAIMETGPITVGLYGNTIVTMIVMLILGIATASLGKQILDVEI